MANPGDQESSSIDWGEDQAEATTASAGTVVSVLIPEGAETVRVTRPRRCRPLLLSAPGCPGFAIARPNLPHVPRRACRLRSTGLAGESCPRRSVVVDLGIQIVHRTAGKCGQLFYQGDVNQTQVRAIGGAAFQGTPEDHDAGRTSGGGVDGAASGTRSSNAQSKVELGTSSTPISTRPGHPTGLHQPLTEAVIAE